MRRPARTILLTGVVCALLLALAGTGSAQLYPPDRNGDIGPDIITDGGDPDVVQPSRAGELPFTGGDVLLLVVIGTALIGSGVFLVRRLHRTSADN